MPMDRLLCGDVGFGKTEVALRAAFKAVLDGKPLFQAGKNDRINMKKGREWNEKANIQAG